MSSLGKRIKTLRTQHNLKQSDIADLISVTLRQVQRYEKDESDMPLSKLLILADYFNVTLDYLVGRSDQ
ncbi:helix-turn-helix domain-containing protein [Heyndrickxia camelliae]|uniref:XRE family transcriptional regulator n=1 Tax=Heyndrickxia camelliae TaxID=1707093 RepID=A0A2N3LEK9_9BACI|nr:helix-turn-helix transcriptional regulator [Heyndrickxia camelliae]PKR83062.1 XRE family transcriptional regulator [Heyndrickxia camelliae]